jgi:hypothetical protein
LRRSVPLTVMFFSLLVAGASSAARVPVADPIYVVTVQEASEARTVTLTYERRLGLDVQVRYPASVGGFAARLTEDQARALRRDARADGPLAEVSRTEIEVAAFLRDKLAPTGVIDSLEAQVGFRTTARFTGTVAQGFVAKLTAARLAVLARRPEIGSIRTAGHIYIASVRAGVDGVAKANDLHNRVGVPLRHTYDDSFSFSTTSPSQIAAVVADADIVGLEFNRYFHIDDAITPLQMGKGVGKWKLGMPYAAAYDLLRTTTRPSATDAGCYGYPQEARWVDYYRQTRLSWQHGELTNIATTQPGTRTATGFAIGTATLAQVRARFPSAEAFERPSSSPYWKSQYRLGRFLVAVTRPTGVEAWVSTLYWFDRRGTLVALEILKGGC